MRDKVESTAKVKINGISLTLGADKWGNKIKIRIIIIKIIIDEMQFTFFFLPILLSLLSLF
jgi:hypothetical protein